MKTTFSVEARKRPVIQTLNEDLMVQVRGMTDNHSGVVESLLADDVEHERQQRIAKTRAPEATVAMWNDFNARRGSYADVYSPL